MRCLVCFRGFMNNKQLCLHYLSHGIDDLINLGYKPLILRQAVKGPKKVGKRTRLTEMARKIQEERKRKEEIEQELAATKEREKDKTINIQLCSYKKTKVDDPKFVPNQSLWDAGAMPLTDKQMFLLTRPDINHSMLHPFWPTGDTFMRHMVDYQGSRIHVGVVNKHVTVFYPRASLDLIAGGVGLLLHQIQWCRELAIKDPKTFGFLSPSYVNVSHAGIEIVLQQKTDLEVPFLDNMYQGEHHESLTLSAYKQHWSSDQMHGTCCWPSQIRLCSDGPLTSSVLVCLAKGRRRGGGLCLCRNPHDYPTRPTDSALQDHLLQRGRRRPNRGRMGEPPVHARSHTSLACDTRPLSDHVAPNARWSMHHDHRVPQGLPHQRAQRLHGELLHGRRLHAGLSRNHHQPIFGLEGGKDLRRRLRGGG
jgi:hypothetical protein